MDCFEYFKTELYTGDEYSYIKKSDCDCGEIIEIDKDFLNTYFIKRIVIDNNNGREIDEYITYDKSIIDKGKKTGKIKKKTVPLGYYVLPQSKSSITIDFPTFSLNTQEFIKSTFTDSDKIGYLRLCELNITQEIKNELSTTISKGKYKLFRGISWETPSDFAKVYNKIVNKKDNITLNMTCISSWSTSFCDARKFAYRREIKKEGKEVEKERRYGIVFEFVPKTKNILVDFRSVLANTDKVHIKDFQEIMLLPGKYKIKIKAILKDNKFVNSTKDW
jgi:hypothetical protein